jgi:hypothetical protein
MKIINNTEHTLNFQYGSEDIALESGDIFEFNCFQIEKLDEIKKLVNYGFVTLLDFDDEEESVPFDLLININTAKRTIEPRSTFFSLDFDKGID